MRARNLRIEWKADPNRFGLLEPLRSEYVDKKTWWICQCSCGSITRVELTHLTTGATQSCGCLRRSTRRLEYGEHSRRQLYRNYAGDAQKRHIPFSIDYPTFCKLIEQNCYICGAQPDAVYYASDAHGPVVYNGIDRMDNDSGYTAANCQPCCRHCNRAKMARSWSEFVQWIIRVYRHLQLEGYA